MLINTTRVLQSVRQVVPLKTAPYRRYKMRKKQKDLSQIELTKNAVKAPQLYDYFLVLDFEATCEKAQLSTTFQQEIIEFPVYKVDGKNFEVEGVFHSFVRPEINTEITNYCSTLTGITQADVENEGDLAVVLENFDQWMSDHVFSLQKSHIFVTSGDWDLKKMLPTECALKNISTRKYFYPYVNINKSFAHTIGRWPRHGRGRLSAMLTMLELPKSGEFHHGTSDCENIVNIMKSLAEKGCVFVPNGMTRRENVER